MFYELRYSGYLKHVLLHAIRTAVLIEKRHLYLLHNLILHCCLYLYFSSCSKKKDRNVWISFCHLSSSSPRYQEEYSEVVIKIIRGLWNKFMLNNKSSGL